MGILKRGIGRAALLVAVCLTFVGGLTAIHAVKVHASGYNPIANGFGDPHNCLSLAQHDGAALSSNNPYPNPSYEYPNGWQSSPTPGPLYLANGNPATFTWSSPAYYGASSITACNDQPTPGQSFDGFGEPFQCIELIQRYAYIRWGDNPLPVSYGGSWGGNASQTWPQGQHPGHFQQETNGATTTPPAPGDIIVWGIQNNPNGDDGHVAIIMSVNISGSTGSLTTLEQKYSLYTGGFPEQASVTESITVSNGKYTINNDNRIGSDVIYGWLHDTTNPGSSNTGSSNPTVNVHEVYAIGANSVTGDHDLYNYHYVPNSSGVYSWGTTDVSGQFGIHNLVGQPSAAWLKQNGGLVHDVFANDSSGHLQEFYFENSAWNTNSPWSASYTGIPANGVTFTGSPFGFSYYDATGAPHHSVYELGTNGNIFHYSWPVYYSNVGYWQLDSTTGSIAPPSGSAFVGTPTAYAYDSAGDQLLYAVATDSATGTSSVLEYSNPFGSTAWTLVNTFSLPAGREAMGNPSAYSYTDAQGTHHFVYVTGTNGQEYVSSYNPTTKTWSGLSAMLGSTVSAVSAPNAHPSFQGTSPDYTPTQFAYARNSAGHLEESYATSQTPSSWASQDLAPTGSYTMTGAPVGYTYLSSSGTTTHIVFFTGSDGNIHDAYYPYYDSSTGKNVWAFTGLPVISGVSFSDATPSGYGVPTNV